MKKLRVFLAIVAMLTFTLMGCGSSSSSGNAVSITILQTSDVHDHAGGYGSAASYSPLVTGNDTVLGGYARLAAYITGVKNEKGSNNVLLCDSGDFTMGTVYTMTLASTPLSFMFFSMMQYDAITIGNHELDLGPGALAGFITSAKNNTTYPFSIPILASNMNPNGYTPITKLIDNGIVQSVIIEKAGIKIGILGRMGTNAVFDAANKAPLTFDSGAPDSPAAYTALQTQVNALRASGAQLVVLLSHEGFTVDAVTGYAKGNDANLADAVSGIDVILSGHLHINQTALKTVKNTNNTILVEPGSYGQHIARLDLKVDKTTGKITSYTSTNPTIDDTIAGDPSMDYVVSTVVNPALNTALYPAFVGLFGGPPPPVDSILDTVAKNNVPIDETSITTIGSFTYPVGESVLGNLAADSYRNAINGIWAQAYAASGGNVTIADAHMAAATGDSMRVDIAFIPGGVIRDPLAVEDGTISFADLYNVVPLGGDPLDETALGYPLLTTYVKALDIYKVVAISLSMGMDLTDAGASADSDYYINFAGIYVNLGTNLGHFGHGFDVYLCPPDLNSSSPNYDPTAYNSKNNGNIPYAAGTLINLATDTSLYKVTVDLYTLEMMYMAGLGINTYDSSGTLLTAPYYATLNRVKTGAKPEPYYTDDAYKYTTLRAWQAMELWSWAAGLGATSNLSNAGYFSSAPKRIQ